MRLNDINKQQVLYVGNNLSDTVIVPGFCSVYLVQALFYAGPYVHRFLANPTMVNDDVFRPLALDGNSKDMNIPKGGIMHSSGECIITESVRSVIMSPSLILGELKSRDHDLYVRGFYHEVNWSAILEYPMRFGELYPDFVRFALNNELIDDEDDPDEVFERYVGYM